VTVKTGVVVLNSWAGTTRHRITILRETPKRFLVRWDETTALRRFRPGGEYYVPKRSVVILGEATR
jgi:hypothetical protein